MACLHPDRYTLRFGDQPILPAAWVAILACVDCHSRRHSSLQRCYQAAKEVKASADLFGHVAVSVADVHAWLRAVPRLDPTTPSARRYVRQWNVVDKIIHHKLIGEFWVIVKGRE